MADLSRLSFGAPAAERDIRRGLDAYFIESAAYRNMNSGAKTILVGNRGAGKSAILKTMAHRHSDKGASVIELTPEDYSYEFLSGAMARETEGSWAKLGAYAVAWKYLLLVLIMKELTKRHGRIRRGAESQIFSYLRDNHRGVAVTPFDSLISYLRRIESVKLGSYEAGIRTRELQRLYKLEELEHLLEPLRRLCGRAGVTVVVDELDRGWDASEDAQSFVAGLFQACMTLNDLSPRLRVCMSLRQELYDNIPALYDDAQKFRDLIEIVRWDEHSLWRLIASRIRHSVPGFGGRSDDECWAAVFRDPRWSFRHIVERSLHRPREIIQYCSHALEHARQHRSGGGVRISRADILAVEATYSGERTRDIASEYRFQHPGLLAVFEAFRGHPPVWSREKLELQLLDMATGYVRTSRDAVSWMADRDPDHLLDTLWNVGFICEHSGLSPSWDGPGTPVSAASPRGVDTFAVHPMFRQYVGTLP